MLTNKPLQLISLFGELHRIECCYGWIRILAISAEAMHRPLLKWLNNSSQIFFFIAFRAFFSSLETCAWLMPISSATSICVLP